MIHRPGRPVYRDYEPGHFTRLLKLHNFPPSFVTQIVLPKFSEDAVRERAAKARQAQVALGNTGTIVGISRKADAALVISRAKRTGSGGRSS